MSLKYPINILDQTENAFQADVSASSVKFTIYERGDSTSDSQIESIYMHMPLTFENPMKVDWESKPIGLLGQSVQTAGAITDNIAATTKAYAGGYAGRMKQTVLGGVAGAANSLSFGDTAVSGQDVVEYHSGKIINPYMKMLFKGLDFRSFSMVFNFLPKNEAESNEIYEIIKAFRKAALPENGGGFMTYPREVEIEYLNSLGDSANDSGNNDGANKWLNKFKRCVITDLNVNYTGAGFYNSMRDGFPAQTMLKLTFTENELVFRRDVDEGY